MLFCLCKVKRLVMPPPVLKEKANMEEQKTDKKLTRKFLRGMKPGCTPVRLHYDTAAEYESARQNAYYIKRTYNRADGAQYQISSNIRTLDIEIRLVKKKDKDMAKLKRD